jgi:hypothetical protein
MKKTFQFIVILVIFLAGFFAATIVERIVSAQAKEKFYAERSRCQKILMQLDMQYEGSISNLDAGYQRDYYCIDWSKLPHSTNEITFNEYPLAYDRSMTNHNGRGINILMVQGTIMWDANAEWLKIFAAVHPDDKLPIPE